jgi:NADH-quinone oxidoreductase subunit E
MAKANAAGRSRGNGKPRTAEPTGSRLYEIIKGIDFERRELTAKQPGKSLFDLVRDRDGSYRCYACTLCERNCPVDCIEIDYCPEHPELPWDVAAEAAAAAAAQPEVDMKLFDPVIARLREGYGMVEALHTTQETFGYLPRKALENIADELTLPFSRVYGVATFYNQFRLKPVGKYIIDVCMGTACHVAGAPLIVEAFTQELGIPVGETTEDQLFTLQTVNCVGACALAPVVRVGDEETYGRLTPNNARKLVRQLRKREEA